MKNTFYLKGKIALVTSGNGGIAIGMGEGLASHHGATKMIWGTNKEKNVRAVDRSLQTGSEIRAAKFDVFDDAAVPLQDQRRHDLPRPGAFRDDGPVAAMDKFTE